MRSLPLLLAAGLAACGGAAEQATTPPRASVASVAISPASVSLTVGDSVQFSAVPRDASGTALTGRTVDWTTGAPAVASVSSTGLVKALAAGTATISATSEGIAATSNVIVVAKSVPGDWAITAARFTQGVQDSVGSAPMVLNGNAAVVDVLMTETGAPSASTQLVLRLTSATGALVRADTVVVSHAGAAPTYASPDAQFLVPASALQSGLRWQVVRDPRGTAPDSVAADDSYPPGGPATLATVSVPDLDVRFVPVVLSSNGGATGNITASNLDAYLRTTHAILPLARINAYVGPAFVSTANFGTPPSGGASAFWVQLVADLDLARVADTAEVGTNWFGVVAPPAGFNYTYYGGFSYIPSSGDATGPQTRTSSGVEVGWFSVEEHARDLVAHELSHTFGRMHAPCGGAGAPLDPSYPVAGGTLDLAGEDVYSWAAGSATSAVAIPTSRGDEMGYCEPVWSSFYTYSSILAFRGTAAGAVAARAAALPPTRVLVIRGTVKYGDSLSLLPAFALRARPGTPERSGPYRLEGFDAGGRSLFRYAFAPAVLDHDPTRGTFAFAVPISGWSDTTLATIRVQGPEGTAALSSSAVRRTLGGARPALAEVVRSAAGATAVCPDAAGTLVLADGSGVVSVASAGGSAALPALAGGTGLTVLCSDGLHTSSARLVVPR